MKINSQLFTSNFQCRKYDHSVILPAVKTPDSNFAGIKMPEAKMPVVNMSAVKMPT